MSNITETLAPLLAPLAPPAATPENTPVPGGGSWRWDYSACCWQANTPALPEAPAVIDATPPNQE